MEIHGARFEPNSSAAEKRLVGGEKKKVKAGE
jgi:hypothetical protein